MRRAVALQSSLLPLIVAFLAATAAAQEQEPAAESNLPSDKELEAAGAVIGDIILQRDNIFDLSNPKENKALYRLANRWHVMTRDEVIRSQLLIVPGQEYSRRLLDESARILRRTRYLFDAKLTPIRYEDGVVDILVQTRDVWTLIPDFSFSRTGGENKWRIGLVENNLLGFGTRVKVAYEENVDRDVTLLEYSDRNVARTRADLLLQYADSSDGGAERFRLVRPFYSLDATWSAGTDLYHREFETRFFELGEEVAEYRQDGSDFSLFFGSSAGVRDGWVRRWTGGVMYDDTDFSEVLEPELPQLIPEDRKLVYPFLSLDIIEDDFRTTTNRNTMERTEDFLLGTRFLAKLGFASESFGADRESLIYDVFFSRGFGSLEKRALLIDTSLTGRVDEGDAANTLVTVNARYYNQQSKKWLFFMGLDGAWGDNLDLDNLQELGGDTGLRGYPLRYQTGDSRLLFTIEQRYFSNWYPFRIVRVGYAAFADVGRTWGDNPAGADPLGWLADVGVGMRFTPTRTSSKEVFHLDVAFPLNGDDSIDSVQIILEAKRRF